MITSIRLSFPLFAVILFLFINIGAQPFEGKIISKEISISVFPLDELISDDEDSNTDTYDEEKESENFNIGGPQIPIKIMDKYYSLSIEEIKKAVDKFKNEFGEDYMGQPLYNETTSEIFLKDSQIRTDTKEEGMKMSILMDSDKGTIKVIQWDQRLVINMDYNKINSKIDAALGDYNNQNDDIEKNEDNFQPTGIKKNINGFNCELYKGTSSQNSYEHLWLSKSKKSTIINSLGNIYEMSAKINSEETGDADFDFYTQNELIPILTKSMPDENMLQVEEILSVEQKTIDNTIFEIPKGFKQMNMSEMMNNEMKH